MGKIVITSTGRCGTTFLIQLFSNLGLNTGYSKDDCINELKRFTDLRGGIEHGWTGKKVRESHILKNPEYMYEPLKLIQTFDIDLAIIPIREALHVAKSREYQDEQNEQRYGGFWRGATNAEEQAIMDVYAFHEFIRVLSVNEIPYVTIGFKRMIEDWNYLYHKLKPMWDDLPLLDFKKAHQELADVGLIRF